MSSFVHMKRSKLFSYSCINFYFFAVKRLSYVDTAHRLWISNLKRAHRVTEYWHINKWRTILWTLKFAQQSESAHNDENLIHVCEAWSTYQMDSIIFRFSFFFFARHFSKYVVRLCLFNVQYCTSFNQWTMHSNALSVDWSFFSFFFFLFHVCCAHRQISRIEKSFAVHSAGHLFCLLN